MPLSFCTSEDQFCPEFKYQMPFYDLLQSIWHTYVLRKTEWRILCRELRFNIT